jgi:SOS-response transcriptional repressor LexA
MKRKVTRNHLAEWRKFRDGMTQEALADAIGTNKANISRLESGQRGLSQKWLERLAPALDATPAELLEEPGKIKGGGRTGVQLVPLIDSIQAGHWTEVADPYPKGDGVTWIPVRRHVGPRAFALEIDGPSMEPEFHDKDVVIIDPDLEARPGHYVAARIDEDNLATFKRFRVKGHDGRGRPIVELVPLNPDWPVMTLNVKGGRVIGVAVEHHRILV